MFSFSSRPIICFEVNGNNQDPKPYDTLQACASISVLKLYNFHLPHLVAFVNKLYFCLVSQYLGLPVLTKYFENKEKKKLFVS